MSIFFFLTLFFILAIPAFCTAIPCGLQQVKQSRLKSILLAIVLASVHSILFVIGRFAVSYFGILAPETAGWIPFALLFIVGVKMLVQGVKYKITQHIFDLNNRSVLLLLSCMSGIDAFIVGIGTSPFNLPPFWILILFCIIFTLSIVGLEMGRKAFFFNPKIAQVLGGILLIFLSFMLFATSTPL